MSKLSKILEDLGIGSGFLAFIFTSHIENVLGLILSIVSIISIIVGIVSKVISWYRKASEDGKITKEELKELLLNIDYKKTKAEIKQEIENIKEKMEDKSNDGN